MATTISSTPSTSSLPSLGSASSSEGSTEASSSAIIHYGQEVTVYEKSLYFETGTGNKVARKSFLLGSQNIRVTRGKSIIQIGAVLRGDLANISLGRYSIIHQDVVLRPPYKQHKGTIAFFPLNIGDHVVIERDSVVQAISVGSYVHIGARCIIGKRCILQDGCKILDDTVLPADTVVPPLTVFGGFPGVMCGELPDCWEEMQREATLTYYNNFKRGT